MSSREQRRYRAQKEEDTLEIETVDVEEVEIDEYLAAGKLPPRSVHHRKEEKTTKVKIQYPIIRLLLLFFFLLLVVIISVYTIGENKREAENANKQSEGFEPVDIKENDNLKNDPITEDDKEDEEQENTNPAGEDDSTQKENDPAPSVEEDDNKEEGNNKEDDDTSAPTQGNGKVQFHVVQPNETLYRIAIKYFNSPSGVEKIQKANDLTDSTIQAGQTLRIPLE